MGEADTETEAGADRTDAAGGSEPAPAASPHSRFDPLGLGLGDFWSHVRDHGPVDATDKLLRGELGGPFLRQLFKMYGKVTGMGTIGAGQWWLSIVLVGPVLGFALLSGTDRVLRTGHLWLEIACVVTIAVLGMLAAVCLYLLAIRKTRETWGKHVRNWSAKDLVWWGELLFVLPTVAFAAVAALLVYQNVLPVSGVHANDPNLAFKTLGTFAWNLADVVPLLAIPETLHWKAQLQFTSTWGGALVLAYKVVLIFPLAQLAALATAGVFGTDNGLPPAQPASGAGRAESRPPDADRPRV